MMYWAQRRGNGQAYRRFLNHGVLPVYADYRGNISHRDGGESAGSESGEIVIRNRDNPGGWFISAVVPAMVCFCLMPLLVYKLLDPELKRTPEAKAMGKQALGELGSMSSNEKKVAFGFVLALVGWGPA